jgi:Ca2+-binding EF-hand superfamily protein
MNMKTGVIIFIATLTICFSHAQEGLDSDERRAQEKAELEKWAERLYGLFRGADTDGDKTLSLLELRNHLDKKMKDNKTSENDLLLKILRKKNPKLDIDQDNILSKAELVRYLDAFIEEENKQGLSSL